MLRRLQSLVAELQAADPSGRLVMLLLGEIASLNACRDELQRVTRGDARLKAAALAFLEGLQALRDAERQAAEDERLLAGAIQ